uniref:Putative secreted protein n=1 Tax=Anopheles marajoara TaxID=58244 RepID=A0A2M4C924_9DIPT
MGFLISLLILQRSPAFVSIFGVARTITVQSNVKWEIKEIKSFAEGTASESEVIGLAGVSLTGRYQKLLMSLTAIDRQHKNVPGACLHQVGVKLNPLEPS